MNVTSSLRSLMWMNLLQQKTRQIMKGWAELCHTQTWPIPIPIPILLLIQWILDPISNVLFCFFGVGSQNFPLKNFSCEVDLGEGRSRWDWLKMGAQHPTPKVVHAPHPPLVVYDTFPKHNQNCWTGPPPNVLIIYLNAACQLFTMIQINNKLGLNWAKLGSSWDLTSLQLVCIE